MEDLARILSSDGVRALFGVPGSGASYDLILALQGHGVPFVGVAHEGAGAIMAGAYGRQSGAVGCSIAIKGPGLANMLPGIVSNAFEAWPSLSIAEAVGPRTPRGRVHKRLNQQALVSSVVKAYATPDPSGHIASRLLAHAKEEIPGPVHLDLAAGADPSFTSYVPSEGSGSSPAVEWSEVLRRIASSARPVLLVGALACRAEWRRHLGALRVPVLTTLGAKGVCDEHLPQSGGVVTGDGKVLSPEHRILREADLVIGLGLRNTEILNPATISGPLILVDAVVSPGDVGFRITAAHPRTESDQFEELLVGLRGREWGLMALEEVRAALSERLLRHPWLPAAVFAELQASAPAAVFVSDTGSFCTIAEHVWCASDPRDFLCSANGRYMGTSVPMAIGAALANPGRPVICAAGDGGMATHFSEIRVALQCRLPILFLLLTDGRYGSIAAAIDPARRRDEVLSIPHPSWYRAAQSLGCPSERVDDMTGLRDAVGRWCSDGGPWFLEVPFDPDAYLTMTRDLR